MRDNITIVTKHLADLSAGNWADYRAALSGDAIYEETATHQRARGADNCVRTIQRWKHVFSDLQARLLHSYVDGNTVIAEVEWQGTHDGPFDGPFGTIPPTMKRDTLRAAIVFELDADGKIVEARQYFDLLTWLVQLGVARPARHGRSVFSIAAR